jgi:hypothetical protein
MVDRRSAARSLGLFALALAPACSEPAATGGAGGGGGGEVIFGLGGAPSTICEPGTVSSCYEGPAGTLGVGICRDGLERCAADGKSFGACEGQVLPKPKELCDTPEDDDCNGRSDEGCGCAPGAKEDCYDGPAGTAGVGLCKSGKKTCLGDGSGFGACEGEVTPVAEDCATPADEDCDGSGACATGGTLVSKVFGGPLADAGLAVATDAQGDVVVVGRFQGTIDLGGGPLASAGSDDLFVAKYLANGVFLWAKRFGDAASQRANGVAIDFAGNVFVGGGFDGVLDFGKTSLTSAGGGDGFVACFDSSGNFLWARSFGDAAAQEVLGVAADASGDVTVTGRMAGSADFGGGPLPSAGGTDAFVAQLDVSGSFLWAKVFGDAAAQEGRGVAADGNGAVWVTGRAAGTIDLGGGPLAAKGDDVFVAKLDGAGAHVASHLFGGAGAQAGSAVSVDGANDATIAGFTMEPIDLGTGVLPCGKGVGLFVARFDATSGATKAAACFGTAAPSADEPLGAACTAAGQVVVAAPFWGSVELGQASLASAGGADVLVARLDSKLAPLSARRYGDGKDQLARAVAVDPKGFAWFTGSFEGSIDLGAKPVASAGGEDGFLAKVGP